jgi:hypothetical protein
LKIEIRRYFYSPAITGVAAFSEWVPSSLFYAGVVSVIGMLIYLGKLHDEWMYALAVSAINFFLFYIIKCGKGASEVRVLLTRASFAGERLRRMKEKRSWAATTGTPPAPSTPPAPLFAASRQGGQTAQ